MAGKNDCGMAGNGWWERAGANIWRETGGGKELARTYGGKELARTYVFRKNITGKGLHEIRHSL